MCTSKTKSKKNNKIFKNNTGFILVELLAAMAIFAIGVMTIFALFVNATKGATFSIDRTNSSFSSVVEAANSIVSGGKDDLTSGEYDVGINKNNQWVLIPRAGLVGHFLLSNDAVDSSGYGNDGIMSYMNFGIDRKNQRYNAGRFNGTTSYIQTEYAFSLQVTGPLTVSAWVLGTGEGQRYIAGKYNSFKGEGGYLLSRTDSNYNFQITGPEGTISILAEGDNLPWEHIVGVYDPGKPSVSLYINGELKESTTTNISSINVAPGIEFFIGTDAGKTNFWEGLISDVRVYNRILTSNEVSGLYGSYSNKYDRYLVVPDPGEGLLGYWNFNEGEGCVVNDNSNNNNHGILEPECDTLSPIWTEDRYGKQSRSLEFDGTSTFISIPDNSSLQIKIENEISVSAWVKLPDILPSASGTMMILYKKATNPEDYSFALIYNKDDKGYGWAVSQGSSENLDYIKSTSTVIAGEWQYVTATFDGTDKKLYIDNERINDVASSTLENSGTDNNFYIGQGADGNNKYEGFIDDVKIYNHALSESEIMSSYLGNINYYSFPVIQKNNQL
jgi:type II secretory pathway pseudopilin PulG